jgi:hypothetical protein
MTTIIDQKNYNLLKNNKTNITFFYRFLLYFSAKNSDTNTIEKGKNYELQMG